MFCNCHIFNVLHLQAGFVEVNVNYTYRFSFWLQATLQRLLAR